MAGGAERRGSHDRTVRRIGILLLALALLLSPAALGWWIGSGSVGPGLPRTVSRVLALFLAAAGSLAILVPGDRRAARLAVACLALFLVAPVLSELYFRVGIAVGVERLRDPFLYADGFTDGDLWKLYYRWKRSERRAEGDSRGNSHPLFGWSVRPSWHNPLGASGRPRYALDYGAPTVLCFGDSFMAGTLPTEGDRIPEILDRSLPDVAVHNLAMGGYGLDQAYLRLRETHRLFRRPAIVFGILLTDLDRAVLPVRTGQKPFFEIEEDRLVLEGLPIDPDSARWFAAHPPRIRSYFLAWAVQGLRVLDAGGDPRELRYGRPEKKRLGERLVAAVAAEADDRKLPLVFVLFYSTSECVVTSWREPFLRGLVARTGHPVIDTKPLLARAAAEEGRDLLSYYGRDWHLNAEGNRIVAGAVLDALQRHPRGSDTLDDAVDLDPMEEEVR